MEWSAGRSEEKEELWEKKVSESGEKREEFGAKIILLGHLFCEELLYILLPNAK